MLVFLASFMEPSLRLTTDDGECLLLASTPRSELLGC